MNPLVIAAAGAGLLLLLSKKSSAGEPAQPIVSPVVPSPPTVYVPTVKPTVMTPERAKVVTKQTAQSATDAARSVSASLGRLMRPF